MSKLTDYYGTLGIHNPHGFAERGNVYVSFRPAPGGRYIGSSQWMVHRPGFQTDPSGHFLNNYDMAFRGRKNEFQVLEVAKAWASAKYGIKEWARTPFGSWMDAEFVKRRMAELAPKKAAHK